MNTKTKKHTRASASQNRVIWIGEIPEIFGYGINVAAETEAECLHAFLRLEFAEQKAVRDGLDAMEHFESYNRAFEYFGGRIVKIELGKAYFGSFGD